MAWFRCLGLPAMAAGVPMKEGQDGLVRSGPDSLVALVCRNALQSRLQLGLAFGLGHRWREASEGFRSHLSRSG